MCAHIVLAEDDAQAGRDSCGATSSGEHHASVVGDGAAALDRVRRRPPDLLVLDVMLPGMDGLGLCRALRAGVRRAGAHAHRTVHRGRSAAGLDLGADDYLTKPFSPRELMARIRTLLRRAAGRRASPDRCCGSAR